MKVEIISNVINDKVFMKYFNNLIVDDLENKALTSYVSLLCNQNTQLNDKRLKDQTVLDNGKTYPLLPILNKHNTAILANDMKDIAQKLAQESQDFVSKIQNILPDKTYNTTHNILSHFVLGNLWQIAYSRKTNNPFGGSLVVIDNPEQCKVIYSEIIGINSSQLVVYWQNSLQGNNYVYTEVLGNDGSIKMLRSRESNGFMLPYGDMEGHFVRLKLAQTKRIKGSHVPTYISNLPVINLQVIKSIKNELIGLAKLSNKYFVDISKTIKESKGEAFANNEHLHDCHILQAGYYVWCYAVYQEWVNNGVLKEPETVKNVLGVRQII